MRFEKKNWYNYFRAISTYFGFLNVNIGDGGLVKADHGRTPVSKQDSHADLPAPKQDSHADFPAPKQEGHADLPIPKFEDHGEHI